MKRMSSPWLSNKSKAMRSEMTHQERIIWRLLRDGELSALNWRRQVAIGNYIVDFISHSARIVVEVDGAQHGEAKQIDHDISRTAWLNAEGYQVLRFWNFETRASQNDIWLTIHAAASQTPAHARMQRWRAENIKQTIQANAHLPLDGGGGREAAGGGARTSPEENASGDSTGEAGGPHPLSHASRDSSPIEGERE
jgi:very-short-patch-repair endonuclease